MIPVLLSSADLGAAQSMLGATLEAWQDAAQMAFEHSVRGGTYDPEQDGPVLRDGVVWVALRHLDLVEFSLRALAHAATELELHTMAIRLAPLQAALARASGSGTPPDVGSAAG